MTVLMTVYLPAVQHPSTETLFVASFVCTLMPPCVQKADYMTRGHGNECAGDKVNKVISEVSGFNQVMFNSIMVELLTIKKY